ncbi:MAG: hypothetical protein LBV79_06200 [Candidatus Adiutrix sp.]|jgi:outer membrane murein-binding lipoprotein Lpp|nr:hypothetical protein [Candidatus Adiutrix sp.]
MEQLLVAVSDDILGAAMKGGGLFAAVAVVQMLLLYLFFRLSRTMSTLAKSVGDLAGKVADLATHDDLQKIEEQVQSAKDKQETVNKELHDRCTKLVSSVSKLEGVCETWRKK